MGDRPAAYRIFIEEEVPWYGFLVVGSEQRDDLFGVDDAEKMFLVVDYGEGAEIVLVEELGDLAAVGVDVATDKVAAWQLG